MWTQALKRILRSTLQLNLSRPIEEQGPLDVIIHKLTDVILEADQNDSQSLELVHRFQVSEGADAWLWGLWGLGKARLAMQLRAVASVEMALPLASCGFLSECPVAGRTSGLSVTQVRCPDRGQRAAEPRRFLCLQGRYAQHWLVTPF